MRVTPERTRGANTAEQVLDLAERLIQTRGYSAFSYNDIGTVLGITKASIHYHFPSKGDLGEAVIARYEDRFAATLTALIRDETISAQDLFATYIGPYRLFATTGLICLCGALAVEIQVLPAPMRARVDRFFAWHHGWLEKIVTRGQAKGEIRSTASATELARMMFATLQGGLLIARAADKPAAFDEVAATLRAQVF